MDRDLPQNKSEAAPALAIEAVGLCRNFGTVHALKDLSVSIRKGEFFCLLGPSGCGKTTLLRLIAGLDLPDRGMLKIGGKDAASIPAHLRPVNTVFQSYALFPQMTVRDNVSFGLRMRKVPSAEIRERVDRVMALVHIAELHERRPHQLSGGQKQRVALARAIVNEPEVLLLDEPLGALDLKLRQQLQRELLQLQRRLRITFVYVTHDQEEALVMSDRIAVMNHGAIEQLDAGNAIYERPRTRFVAQFLGSCNLLPGKVQGLSEQVIMVQTTIGLLRANRSVSSPKVAAGADVTLACRPEKIRLGRASGTDRLEENQVAAKVKEVIYSGAETRYSLACGETVFTVTSLNTAGQETTPTPGDSVLCTLPDQALVLLED